MCFCFLCGIIKILHINIFSFIKTVLGSKYNKNGSVKIVLITHTFLAVLYYKRFICTTMKYDSIILLVNVVGKGLKHQDDIYDNYYIHRYHTSYSYTMDDCKIQYTTYKKLYFYVPGLLAKVPGRENYFIHIRYSSKGTNVLTIV